MGGERARARAHAHRHRRRIRHEQGAEISGDESRTVSCRRWKRKTASCCGNPIRSSAISPASTTRPALLSRRTAKQRALASQWMDWQLSVASPAIVPAFLGLHPHAAGKARPRRNQDVAGQDHRRDGDAGQAAGQDRIRRRPVILLRRHSGRRDGLSLPATGAWPPGDAQPRPLGTMPSPNARRFTITSAAFRCRKHLFVPAKAGLGGEGLAGGNRFFEKLEDVSGGFADCDQAPMSAHIASRQDARPARYKRGRQLLGVAHLEHDDGPLHAQSAFIRGGQGDCRAVTRVELCPALPVLELEFSGPARRDRTQQPRSCLQLRDMCI